VPSAAFAHWQNDRLLRLNEVEAHCAAVLAQVRISAIPAGLQATAQAQFSAHLALEKGNPNHDNAKDDIPEPD
jgi:hypothetical protein